MTCFHRLLCGHHSSETATLLSLSRWRCLLCGKARWIEAP